MGGGSSARAPCKKADLIRMNRNRKLRKRRGKKSARVSAIVHQDLRYTADYVETLREAFEASGG